MDTFRNIMTGFAAIVVGIWSLIGAGVLLTAGWLAVHPEDGKFVWQWFTWIAIAPELGIFLLICWAIGEYIRG